MTAFLNHEIDAEVYMQQPDGIDWLKPTTSEHSILRLNKALYRLRISTYEVTVYCYVFMSMICWSPMPMVLPKEL